MKLAEARRRLPIVGQIPSTPSDSRRVRSLVDGALPEPRLVVWELTLACDQKCLHCGSRAGARRPDELSTEDCLALVEELAALGTGEVVLIGGEAYLRNDFILIARAIRVAGMRCSMTTGALNINDARLEAMVEAGMQHVSVSIDGLEATHDRLRDVPGSWRHAMDSLDRLRAAGLSISVNTQINAWTMHELEGLMEALLTKGIRGWQLQVTAPFGNAADHPELLLQPYMLLEVYATLERILDRCDAAGVQVWPGNSLGYFGPIEQRLRKHQQSKGHYPGCGSGRTLMGIEADGKIKGCPSLGGPANVAGVYRPGRLRELWASGTQIEYTRTRGTTHLWGFCGECYYREICRGGCTAVAEPLMGRPGNNPFCHHRALEMDRMGARERIELVEAAPGEPFDHGWYRIIRESKDPEHRATQGPIAIDEPRTGRELEPHGVGGPR